MLPAAGVRVAYALRVREDRKVQPAGIAIDTTEKENALLRGRFDFPLRDDDPDAPALVIADDSWGGGSGLSKRVIDRLRQRDGVSYGAGTSLNLGSRYR